MMIETAADKQVFRKDPAKTIANYLRSAFEKQAWPSHPLEWKKYFIEHHIKALF